MYLTRAALARALARGGALLLLLLPSLAGCRAPQTVRIGIVVSPEAVVAAEIAAEEVNAAGGIRRHPLALQVVAGGGSTRASLALAAANDLCGDPSVFGVVGHSNSSASLSAAQIYNARKVVQIAPTSSTPLLSRVGPYTFRLVPSDFHQGRFLADQIMAGDRRPRTAMFFVNDDYGHALHEELRARLLRGQVPIVFDAPYNHETSLPDAAGTALRVAKGAPELLVWIGRAPQLQELLPALRRAIPGIAILASDGIDAPTTDLNAEGVLTGVRFVRLVDPNADRPNLARLRERFRARAGIPLTAEGALTYDAVMLLAAAAESAGLERDEVRDHIAALGSRLSAYQGATGAIEFDADGDPAPAYSLAEIGETGIRIVPGNPEP
jgi:branched-chain amino acid transport system substrate-binding protein